LLAFPYNILYDEKIKILYYLYDAKQLIMMKK